MDRYEEHKIAQAVRNGRQLTPAQRLRWLEQTMAELSRWQGRARKDPSPATTPQSDGEWRRGANERMGLRF